MTAAPSVSLIIVSRHRPDELCRCLTAIQQQDHPEFEVVVVTDPRGAAVARGTGARVAPFDEDNISAARNAGIVAAAGDVLAFTDDDAVPDPRWLRRLTAPFADPQVVAAGGPVLGRNGISWEWQAGWADRLGRSHPFQVPEGRVSVLAGVAGRAVEIKGVNCAYRAETLAAVGGFDPAYRYYLDETDVNMRLARESAMVAVVPDARVLHAKAASRQRDPARVPVSLFDKGASLAVFLRRHGAAQDEAEAERQRATVAERQRLERLMLAGAIEPGEVPRLLGTFRDGLAHGAAGDLPNLMPLPRGSGSWMLFPARPSERRVLAGRIWQAARLRREAVGLARAGAVPMVMLLGPSMRFHRLRYDPAGYWEQSGGLFGKSDRSDPFFRRWRFSERVLREKLRNEWAEGGDFPSPC